MSAREYVKAGAAFLDGARPGWEHRIDRDILDISCGRYCIVGQLEGSYIHGMDALGVVDASVFGFSLDLEADRVDGWHELTAEWLAFLAEREAENARTAPPLPLDEDA